MDEYSSITIWYDNFKTSNYVMLKLEVRIFYRIWEITRQRALRSGRAGPGWVGPGRAGSSRNSIIWLKKHLLFLRPYRKKINSFWDTALFESPIWLWKEALERKFAMRC